MEQDVRTVWKSRYSWFWVLAVDLVSRTLESVWRPLPDAPVLALVADRQRRIGWTRWTFRSCGVSSVSGKAGLGTAGCRCCGSAGSSGPEASQEDRRLQDGPSQAQVEEEELLALLEPLVAEEQLIPSPLAGQVHPALSEEADKQVLRGAAGRSGSPDGGGRSGSSGSAGQGGSGAAGATSAAARWVRQAVEDDRVTGLSGTGGKSGATGSPPVWDALARLAKKDVRALSVHQASGKSGHAGAGSSIGKSGSPGVSGRGGRSVRQAVLLDVQVLPAAADVEEPQVWGSRWTLGQGEIWIWSRRFSWPRRKIRSFWCQRRGWQTGTTGIRSCRKSRVCGTRR